MLPGRLLRSPALLPARWVSRSVKRGVRAASAWLVFWRSFRQYNRLAAERQQARVRDLFPRVHERTATTTVDAVYFYQDAWAFGKIVARRPEWHVDVGSHHKYVARSCHASCR